MMRMLKKMALAVLTAFFVASPFVTAQENTVQICAHRGFWKNEKAKNSENTIASLKCAQKERFWGSEIDVHLTKDNVIVVNHNPTINKMLIRETPYSALKGLTLPNGEERPTLDAYLKQVSKSHNTLLVLELKGQGSDERTILMADMCIQKLMDHKLYDPSRVVFISGNLAACTHLARVTSGFSIQYVSRGADPDTLRGSGINGLDYDFRAFQNHPEWVKRAHELGMTVNAWVVNKEEDIREMIALGLDCITTNEPLLVRQILGEREEKVAR